jgi:hypothetical protein
MKIKIVVFISALLSTAVMSHADDGIFANYIGLNVNGGGNVWYGLIQPGPNTLTAFQGLSIGTFTTSQTLLISGGEVDTYKNEGANDATQGNNVTGAYLGYEVNELTPANIPGSFSYLSLGFTANEPFNDAASNPDSTSGDQKWAQIPSTPNVISGLVPGTYQLEVYFYATTSDTDNDTSTPDLYSSNNGNNYIANFTVVPEPTTLALAGLSGLAAFLGIRRRK